MKANYLSLIFAGALLAACSGGGGSDAPQPQQAAPSISKVANQSMAANNPSQPIAFTVTDEEVGSLGFALMSDNESVVPVSGLALGGSGANRSLIVTPAADALGDTYVTVIVTDTAGLSDSTSFLLTVAPEQRSMQQFTRSSFADSEDGDPELVNAVEFAQDADDDDFADLLAQ